MPEATKHDFMVRLRFMMSHVEQTKGLIRQYCPASKLLTKCFTHPANEILAEGYCDICTEVMDIPTYACPCHYYGAEVSKEARKRIHKYFNNGEE